MKKLNSPIHPELLGVLEMRTACDSGKLDASDMVGACLARIAARDPEIRAWRHVEKRDARGRAAALDRVSQMRPLHGIPVGIKDLIDTASMPTEYGSPIYRDHRPKIDALCVQRLIAAGAIPIGKTETTEFAYFTPGPTHNPARHGYTPGGSSSGSAAAVADFHVPLALGTQTAGSVIRPAAFCGVVGYKGTYGWIDMAGIKPLAPSLDTLGVFCRAVADLDLVRRALVSARPIQGLGDVGRPSPRIAVCYTPYWSSADGATRRLFELLLARLEGAGVSVRDFELEDYWADINDAQLSIMSREATASLARERAEHSGELSSELRDMLASGDRVGIREETAAKALATKCRHRLAQVWRDIDVILAPAAPGTAPRGIERTGDPVFNRMWTLLGNPAIALPAGKSDEGLPLAIQLIGPHNEDGALIGHAAWFEEFLKR
jgi:Asp-tRNA(Asn)/Glu-tRNA(Gln) amidotransferase A subunit family amidase